MHHAHALKSPKRSESGSEEPGTTRRTRRQVTARPAPARAKQRTPGLKDAEKVAAYVAATEHARRAPSRHAVWLLHFCRRLSASMTAATLGLSLETVMVHLRRLRLAARRWWDSERRRGGKAPRFAEGSSSPV